MFAKETEINSTGGKTGAQGNQGGPILIESAPAAPLATVDKQSSAPRAIDRRAAGVSRLVGSKFPNIHLSCTAWRLQYICAEIMCPPAKAHFTIENVGFCITIAKS